MSTLATALALILATETPTMDTTAIGDTHLPVARRAHGRMQIRKPVIDDFNVWDHGELYWTSEDSHDANLDILMAARWLVRQCGQKASIKTYLTVWNGGKAGRKSADAQAYYIRCKTVAVMRPDHFGECQRIVGKRFK